MESPNILELVTEITTKIEQLADLAFANQAPGAFIQAARKVLSKVEQRMAATYALVHPMSRRPLFCSPNLVHRVSVHRLSVGGGALVVGKWVCV